MQQGNPCADPMMTSYARLIEGLYREEGANFAPCPHGTVITINRDHFKPEKLIDIKNALMSWGFTKQIIFSDQVEPTSEKWFRSEPWVNPCR